MNNRKFVGLVLGGTAVILAVTAAMTVVIDPLFHYHAPLKSLEYQLDRDNARYHNDGIIRNYDYDAAIVGTSMMLNYKCSQFDELFDVKSIKVPLTGESYFVIDQSVRRIMELNPDTKAIFRCLDYTKLMLDKDKVFYENYPEYLYDDNIFNDVSYVLNKEIFMKYTLETLNYTADGKKTPSNDEYCYTGHEQVLGKESVLSEYKRPKLAESAKESHLSKKEIKRITENVTQNVVETAMANPDTTFYLFYPPYSICWWDSVVRKNTLNKYIEAEKLQTELLLQCPNIKLYSFSDEFDMICNLDNYRDQTHYSADISEQVLEWVKEGKGLITEDNYEERLENMKTFYTNYDYESIFE